MRRSAFPPLRKAGLTLVELCIVLVLLVVIASFTAPIMKGTFSRASLSAASEMLRDGLAKARLAAIQSGQIHAMRFEPKGARWQIMPLEQLSLPEKGQLAPDDPDKEHSPHDMLRLPQNRLPDDVIFAAGDVAASAQVAALLGQQDDQTWSAPIVFNPDGTTSDASILLQNDRQQTIRVTLRGLTGIASASDVGSEAAP
jgi:type II secretory pathway pseudopilin PulG